MDFQYLNIQVDTLGGSVVVNTLSPWTFCVVYPLATTTPLCISSTLVLASRLRPHLLQQISNSNISKESTMPPPIDMKTPPTLARVIPEPSWLSSGQSTFLSSHHFLFSVSSSLFRCSSSMLWLKT